MIELDGQLVTDDMVFAVVLCLNGFHPLMDKNKRGAFWTLDPSETEEDLEDFIRQYQRGQLLVEPRRFAREQSAMRNDVYRLMGIEGKPQGARVQRGSSN